MLAPILDLTPSASGWYYPPAARQPSPVVRQAAPRPALPVPARARGPVAAALGYGPDGRLRTATPPPRLWLLV